MIARLLTRLLAVLAFGLTMSVATPAHATALSASASCVITGPYAPDPTHLGSFSCTVNPSGGTGSYTYVWTVFTWCCGDPVWGYTKTITGNCNWGSVRIFTVYVTDSSGAQVTTGAAANCTKP